MEYKKLGDITKIRTGKLDANASSEDGAYPFFTCSTEPLRISNYSYDCECVLVAGNGDLNVKYYKGKFDAYQRTYIIEDNSDGKLFMPYLYYFMEGYVEELRKQAIGGVIKYIKLRNLTDAMIELPDVEIQKKIVDILSKTKEALDSRNRQIDMLDNLIKARFVEIFGDPVSNSHGWTVRQLHDIVTPDCTISYGIVQPGDAQEEGIPVFRPVDIVNHVPMRSELKKTTKEISDRYKKTILKGRELLITVRANIGDTFIAGEEFRDCNVGRGIVPLRVDENIVALEFLKAQLDNDHFQYFIKGLAKGITLIQLNIVDLRNLDIIIPPLEIQKGYISFAKQVNKSKSAVQKSLDETQVLFDALMQKYFG